MRAFFTVLVLLSTFSSTAMAKKVVIEDGESFTGRYQIIDKTIACGYEDIENAVLGQLDVSADNNGIRIQTVVENYSLDGGLFDLFSWTSAFQNPTYLSSEHFQSNFLFSYGVNDSVTDNRNDLSVDANGLMTLVFSKHSVRGTTGATCHYQRIK